ncbi:hypothetical protein DL96DRAFT_1777615 [Flagelloscypha sp. PMI_526]|nr:hypothetical protein DL96DRAFT_1777615 [Flagelloscypha sp. PMI_526]
MSTVTHPLLDVSELSEGQMKQVEFPGAEGGAVLLSNVGGKINATGAFCTHYGAPLAKGVLTSSGRLVCPWHGACFDACTGDIEDAPAPAALNKFPVTIKDGMIHVSANPEHTTKNGSWRAPKSVASDSADKGVLIVGGGAGAYNTIQGLRNAGYKSPITVLSQENYVPIDRTKLSKTLITDPSKLQWRTAAELQIKYGTTIRLGVTVTSVSPSSKTVTIDEKETISYSKLVLSTGGIPRRLPIDGADLDNVFTFRNVDDAAKLDSVAREGKKCVILGSSFIGMELAAVLSKRKLATLNIVGMEKVPFETILGEEVGAAIQKIHEGQSVTFHLSSKVSKINKVPGEESNSAGSVEIVSSSGETVTLEADFVVLAVGVRPATDFLKNNESFKLEKDGGIQVDEYLKVPGVEDVYAIGDIAHYKDTITGNHKRIEHWNVASNHGMAVGYNIAHESQPKAFSKTPVFWSAQGQQLRYCGVGVGYDEVHIDGSLPDFKFVAYYAKQGNVVAAASMQRDPTVVKISELLSAGKMPTLEEIKGGKDPLSISL